jgi:2-methylaconitate cis-trans-isomerase PrpF
VLRDALPDERVLQDNILAGLFGSPDRRQINGLGGADPLTSKVAIVGRPTVPDADIDYTFGQVSIVEGKVDYAGYCGNVLAAVAQYAVDNGYVKPSLDATTALVRVHVTNVNRMLTANVPVAGGVAVERGGYEIAGVPGTGAPIRIDFSGTIGSITGKLLPTGRAIDKIEVPGRGAIEISVVDAGNPMIFAAASAFGLDGTETPDQLDPRLDLITMLESIRTRVAAQHGIMGPDGLSSDNIPLVALVGPPVTYISHEGGKPVNAATMDFRSVEFFCGKVHKAYGVGETVCTAAAALIPDTVVGRMVAKHARGRGGVRFGHPSGVIEAETDCVWGAGRIAPDIRTIAVYRTARLLMDGEAHVNVGPLPAA